MRRRFSASTGQLSLFTTTSATSPEVLVPAASSDATCSSAARLARMSASLAEAQEWAGAPAPVCGGSTSESSALSAHRLSLLRILLGLAGGGSLRSRRRWPRSGTGGLTFVSELATSATTTSAIVCSSLLPTLTVCGNYNVAELSPKSGDGLVTALRRRGLLPTLTATDGKSGAVSPSKRPLTRQGADNLRDTIGGLLCPTWCEQFMGFPAGWTECDASAIASFRSRRRRRGGSSRLLWIW
jgi:hypothetical protein